LSPEPPDRRTLKRRTVATLRDHLRARSARLARAGCYDVLEVPYGSSASVVDHAYRMLAVRFAPDRLAAVDLSDLRPMVAPMWEQIVKSQELLRDGEMRERYHHMLGQRAPGSLSSWASVGAMDFEAGEAFFGRGQKALIAGDAFKAVSEIAAACRVCPDFPDYEVSLAWARYRADLARGSPREQAIARERAAAEKMTTGRRPWPRALVALAMLCAADDDPDAARWHLSEALACEPNLPAAQQLLGRLR
jgi:hypothetical protein